MERLKIALLAVIAATLVVRTAGDLIPVAHAETGAVHCGAFPLSAVSGKRETWSQAGLDQVEPIRQWLEAHPGSTAYATSLPHLSSIGIPAVALVCVRG
jgi:hypothetical protein